MTFLIKFNLDGDIIWDSYFRLAEIVDGYSGPVHHAHDFAITADGGFVMAGEMWDYSAPSVGDTIHQAWLVKTDSFGCLVPGCQDVLGEGPDEKDFNFNFYPNPTSDFINIYYNSNSFDGESTIELYSINGQHVQSWSLGQNNMTYMLDLQGINPGSYIMNLVNNGELRKSEKVIIQ